MVGSKLGSVMVGAALALSLAACGGEGAGGAAGGAAAEDDGEVTQVCVKEGEALDEGTALVVLQ